jgi:hypothetical protein
MRSITQEAKKRLNRAGNDALSMSFFSHFGLKKLMDSAC